MGTYDVAQVCLNGHLANDRTQRDPQHNKAFCPQCGERTITQCPQCKAPIPGDYDITGLYIGSSYTRPSFCTSCGKPFPWTERAVNSAVELAADAAHLNPEESEQFKRDVGDLTRDTPRTPVAASRFKKVMAKAGGATAEVVKKVIAEIVSETAKKLIWGPGA